MSSRKVIKKIDISKIIVEPWIKPDVPIWVEIMDDTYTFVKKYQAAIVAEVLYKEKKVKLKYDEGNGPADCYANRVLLRSEEPQDLEDLVSLDREKKHSSILNFKFVSLNLNFNHPIRLTLIL